VLRQRGHVACCRLDATERNGAQEENRTMTNSSGVPPTLALAIGDPCGISPELTAGLLADPTVASAARLIVIGDRRVLDMGAQHAGLTLDIETVTTESDARSSAATVLWDQANLDPGRVRLGEVSRLGGQSALANFRAAIELARTRAADGVCFTPFNKAAMRLAHPSYEDEVVFLSEVLGHSGMASEFNVLDRVWNARVTSHVPLSAVAGLITEELVVENLKLTHSALVAAGFAAPRIAVAALNPHAGDGGNFGREEIDTIAPAVAEAKARGLGCEGPFPSDTVFLRARDGQFDAVLTMYHDQGQIAMKLMGFDKGVTLLAGYGFPICTPAHGTAYEIAGKGVANLGAARNAVLLAARMATQPTAKRSTSAPLEVGRLNAPS
jgi:4-hydroxythreonine-4-phosphate dehydrogenase